MRIVAIAAAERIAATHRCAGRRSDRRRADGAERRHQRHRGARELLARACATLTRATGRMPDRGRGDERVRALRRMVRLAALWAKPDAPDLMSARQGTHRRARSARARSWSQRRGGARAGAADTAHRPYLLRPSACLRRRRRRASSAYQRRRAHRALAGARARHCSRELQRAAGAARRHRRRARRPRPVRGSRTGSRPRDARAAVAVAAAAPGLQALLAERHGRRVSPSPPAATSSCWRRRW